MKTASLTVLHDRQQRGDRPCGVYGGCVNVSLWGMHAVVEMLIDAAWHLHPPLARIVTAMQC